MFKLLLQGCYIFSVVCLYSYDEYINLWLGI